MPERGFLYYARQRQSARERFFLAAAVENSGAPLLKWSAAVAKIFPRARNFPNVRGGITAVPQGISDILRLFFGRILPPEIFPDFIPRALKIKCFRQMRAVFSMRGGFSPRAVGAQRGVTPRRAAIPAQRRLSAPAFKKKRMSGLQKKARTTSAPFCLPPFSLLEPEAGEYEVKQRAYREHRGSADFRPR